MSETRSDAPAILAEFLEPQVNMERRDDGSLILSSPVPLEPYEQRFGTILRNAAAAVPDRIFLAERNGEDSWRKLSYGEMQARCNSVAQALLDKGLSQDKPLMILSGNSIDHATLTLAAMQVGIPVAPVSVAYSLMSQDFAKLAHVRDLVEPALVYASDSRFEAALAVACANGAQAIVGEEGMAPLLATEPTGTVESAFAAVGPNTVAKYLFTSGSTGMPKGVINTHDMLCVNQQMSTQMRPGGPKKPPVLLDWLPWNHTYGGNAILHGMIRNQGTLYIDTGRPQPGMFEATLRNLQDISPTNYYSVPVGYAMLVPAMELDPELCRKFFAELEFATYAGAVLPEDLWHRLQALARDITGRRVLILTGWGATETAPSITNLTWELDKPGVIGLPLPGAQIKMVPAGSKMEMRVAGPMVFPGYLKRPDLTEAAFDEEGFYKIGDAGALADPDDPAKGIRFDGRVVEDFKLTTGTWVHVGGVRVAAIAAASPVIQDALVAGHDRDFISLLAWPNIAACRRLAGDELAPEALNQHPAVVAALRDGLKAHNAANRGSSMRVRRVILLSDPPSLDVGEITDKGYINQLTGLEHRAEAVERLYQEPAGEDVIEID
jgi:feruloyl-CoA synthase